MALPEIDYMEYSSDANAQAAYVSNGLGETIDQQQTTFDAGLVSVGFEGNRKLGQSFKLSTSLTVTAVEIYLGLKVGSPTGDWSFRIETDNAGVPSGTLADVNATVSLTPPTAPDVSKGSFATPFSLSGATTYWIVVTALGSVDSSNYWSTKGAATDAYADGVIAQTISGVWGALPTLDAYFKVYVQNISLQSFSEATIKTQGSYALKAVAAITDSLNKTLTHTFASPIDLTGVNTLKFDMRASRTGANVKLGLHDTGGTTTELTPTINSADTYETKTWDISGVADADKNAIDTFVITPTNADAANTVYFDNFRIFSHLLTDTVTLSDDEINNFAFDLLSTITLTDGINNSWLYFRTLSESLSVSDTYTRTWNIVHILIDTCITTDVYSRVWNVVRSLSETINITDIVNKSTTGRTLFDTINVSDVISNVQHRNFVVVVTDSITTVDNLQEWLNKIDKSITWSTVSYGSNIWVLVPTSTNIWM